jgi:hypothetical protein
MSITDSCLAAVCAFCCVAALSYGGPKELQPAKETAARAGELSFGIDSGFVGTPFTRQDPYSFGVRAGGWLSWAPALLAGVNVGVFAAAYGFRSLSDYFGPSRMWLASGSVGYSWPLVLYDGPNGISVTTLGGELSFGYYQRVHEFLGTSSTGSRLFLEAAARLTLVDGWFGSSIDLALLVPLESQPLPLLELGMRMGVWP